MPLRRISSLLTFPHKFLLPALFAVGFLDVLIWGARPNITHPDFAPLVVGYLMPILFEVISVWHGWRLKRVLIDQANQRLYVSNYRREISIPFSEIANVTEFFFSDPKRITIHLHNESEFGKKIVFLATYRFGGWLSGRHPIVNELQQMAQPKLQAHDQSLRPAR